MKNKSYFQSCKFIFYKFVKKRFYLKIILMHIRLSERERENSQINYAIGKEIIKSVNILLFPK